MLWLVILIILLALAFDYINGMHDTANAIATVVSTRVLSPRAAIIMAVTLNFAGALFSEEVAKTIGKGIVDPSALHASTIVAALVAAILWNLLTWWKGIPSSSSHALIGGLIGAGIAGSGTKVIEMAGVYKVLKGLVFSPIIGLALGFLIMLALLWIFRNAVPGKVNHIFRWLQIASASLMAFSHGNGDAQKSMGIITMALVAGGFMDPKNIHIPIWVKLACAAAMAFGTASGGWRIIKTLGNRIIKLMPINGFAAEAAASTVILTASHWGVPVSTTHCLSGAIMGVGSTRGHNAVHWGVAGEMLVAWTCTIPATAGIGALVTLLIHHTLM